MAGDNQSTRRDFLATSAKVATAGLAGSAGCAATKSNIPVAGVAAAAPRTVENGRTIRLGIVGMGYRCRGLLKATYDKDDWQIVAIAEPNESALNRSLEEVRQNAPQRLSPKLDIYHGRDEYRTKLLKREDIDAVIIATPPFMHAQMFLEAFAAGKHFYGEKPMCLTVRDCRALVAAQQKHPEVIAQVGFQRRCDALYTEGIKRIHDGAIGKLCGARTTWNTPWGPIGLPDSDRPWFGRRAESGDFMLEQACHTWDVLNWVTGTLPIAASGFGRKDIYQDVHPGRDVTDYFFAHIEYPNRFMVTHEHCWFTPYHDTWPGLNYPFGTSLGRFTGYFERVQGTEGGIAIHEGLIFPRDEKKEVIRVPGEVGYSRMNGIGLEGFYTCLRTGERPKAGVQIGADAVMVGLLVRKAVDEQRWVKMEEIIKDA